MKKKTTNIIIAAVAVLVLIGAVLIIAFSGGNESGRPLSSEAAEASASSNDISVAEIGTGSSDITEISEIEPEHESENPDDPDTSDVILVLPDGNGEDTSAGASSETSNDPAETPARPVEIKNPADDGDRAAGGDAPIAPYDCGTPGHRCDGPETHAYILNLELKGCPYCGEHGCKSFYAVDDWGNTCYDPSDCPKYDIHNDPVFYCQNCGRKCGDGANGTCVQFVNACSCPNCGEWVEAWTCHTCEN